MIGNKKNYALYLEEQSSGIMCRLRSLSWHAGVKYICLYRLLTTMMLFSCGSSHAAVLDFLAVSTNGMNSTTGLNGVSKMVISPDGKQLYATSQVDHSVVVFSRDSSTGKLSYQNIHQDILAGGLISGMRVPQGIAISPNGSDIYVAAQGSDNLISFARNSLDGSLIMKKIYSRNNGINSLSRPFVVVISPDGAHVYVGTRDAISQDSLLVFSRNATTGTLKFQNSYDNDIKGNLSINDISGIAMSPRGDFLYTTSTADSAISAFARDNDPLSATFGDLRFIKSYSHINNPAITGITRTGGIAMAPDGAHIYVTGSDDNAIAMFKRNQESGELGFIREFKNGSNGISGLAGPFDIILSPNGDQIYISATQQSALVVFRRSMPSGIPEFTTVIRQNDNSGIVDGLDHPAGLAVSPDGFHLYSTSPLTGKIGVFSVRRADLKVTVSDLRDPIIQGEEASYHFQLSNNGPDDATNATLQVQPHPGATISSFTTSANASCTSPSGQLACKFDSLAKDARESVDVAIAYPKSGPFNNGATVYADQHDADLANNTVDETTSIIANLPPIARPDSSTTLPGIPVRINVLENDSDPDGDNLLLADYETVSRNGGTISKDPQNVLTYTPPPEFFGTDSFQYTLSDGFNTATASVSIIVNRPPTALDDNVTVETNESVIILVLANDSDPDGNPIFI